MAEAPASTAGAAGREVDPRTLRKAITGSAVGNATEWYDYGVYAYVAVEIADNFFPESGLVGTFLPAVRDKRTISPIKVCLGVNRTPSAVSVGAPITTPTA